MDLFENANQIEVEYGLLVYLGRSSEDGAPVEYNINEEPKFLDAYNSLLGKGYIKVIVSRLSGDMNIDYISFTPSGIEIYSELESKLLYMNDFYNRMWL